MTGVDWADLVIIGGIPALLVGGLLWLQRGERG